jgi:hypothetical protein
MKEYKVKVYEDRTFWFLNDKLHREDGPAVEWANGTKQWYINGQRHREDGPAIEYADGTKQWYLNGERHREDGPAVEYADGSKQWYFNDQLHREDGPAVEWIDGSKSYYINGKQLSEAEFLNRTQVQEIVEQISNILGKNNIKYKHLKSGKIYTLLSADVINATNKDDDTIMVLYQGMKRDGTGIGKFVREFDEFIEKFKPYNI